uniref:PCNA_N domain-containing protein n=1 Tax=Panagrellus redivivus TaxID=6233 RepID=A0A7E4URZ6_PANRE
MPFLLHALDYGSRCRLCELATPGEVYDLQIAAPQLSGLQPIQATVHISHDTTIAFMNKNGALCAAFKHEPAPNLLDLNNDKLFRVTKTLQIEKFDSKHCAQLIFNKFGLEPEKLRFIRCDLTSKFLHDLSAKAKSDIRNISIIEA